MLLREFCFGPGDKLSDEEIESYQKATKKFIELANLNGVEGKELVKRIYSFLDKLVEDYNIKEKISCHSGCGYCCLQLVCCSTAEMEVIVEHFKKLPRKTSKPIKKKIFKKARSFYLKHENLLKGGGMWQEIKNPLRSIHRGVPCIYLNLFKKCTIYPVRPIDCRTTRSTSPCGVNVKPPESVKFYFDQIAIDIITNEEKKISDEIQVVPLIAWPLTPEFYDFFKK